jgi:uncharacterized protein YbjT (DUF2867 family)
MGTVLVTGATGYVGGRLVPELLARGYSVRVLVRAAAPGEEDRWPGAEVVVGDASNRAALNNALRGVHAAYYLIHSLLIGSRDFEAMESINARNFRQAAEENGVRRIIYLGGLGDVRTFLSPHLRSRMQVAGELQSSATVSTTVLRAAIIIGSGSASYEIVHHLVKRMPVMLLPPWTRTRCQPIGIRDVVRYLVGALECPETAGGSFDIGGTDVLTYENMMRILADILGKRRLFLRPLFSSVRFYAYFTGLLTPVPAPIVRSLMEGLRNDVVCADSRIRSILPFPLLSYREAIVEAMSREEQDAVHTRWSDSYPPAHELAIKLHELKHAPRYTTTYSLLTEKRDAALFKSICRIGGKEGWFHGNWMWRLRGMLDSLLMGVGTARGRRSSSTLRLNDVIDFWRVEALVPNRRLLLRAEMKLPGRAWLEFRIEPQGKQNRLSLQAYYDTNSFPGYVYWYVFLPFHGYIFDRLLIQIVQRTGGIPCAR